MVEIQSKMPQRTSADSPWNLEVGLDMTRQVKWNIPEIVAIEAAIIGHPIKKTTNPNHPHTVAETKKEAFECIEAGAVALHLHVRGDNGNTENDAGRYIQKMREICEPIRDKYGYDVILDACCLLTTFEDEMQLAETGLFEMSPVNAFYRSPSKLLQAELEGLEELGVRTQIALYCDGDLDRAIQWLVEPGILPQPPLNWLYLPSYLTGGTPLPNEFAMVEHLMWMIRRIREIDAESVIMVCSAGRASSYLSTMAMLMGLHVRVGMEDTIYRWPHRDELIESNAEIVRETIKIAEALGRKPATANEFRSLVGLPLR